MPPLSLAATYGISGGSLLFLISFPVLLRWFTSHSFAPQTYFIQSRGDGISAAGLPHSAVRGSPDMCSYPRLFAAYHGLLRLTAPRHPPQTYIRLTILSLPPPASPCTLPVSPYTLHPRLLRFVLPPCTPFSVPVSLPLSCQRSSPTYLSRRTMGLIRVELMTPSLSEKCSNQLSYSPWL